MCVCSSKVCNVCNVHVHVHVHMCAYSTCLNTQTLIFSLNAITDIFLSHLTKIHIHTHVHYFIYVLTLITFPTSVFKHFLHFIVHSFFLSFLRFTFSRPNKFHTYYLPYSHSFSSLLSTPLLLSSLFISLLSPLLSMVP